MDQRDGLQCPSPYLDERRGYLVDWLTQIWVKMARTTVHESENWLYGPSGHTRGIGPSFYTSLAEAEGLSVSVNEHDAGLVDSMRPLIGHSALDPRIADFYERTRAYEIHVSSKWCGLFYPFGWLLAIVFSQRLQQLNVPLSLKPSTEVLVSDIVLLRDADGARVHTGWYRRRRDKDETVYVGLYGHSKLADGTPVLKVSFPLPNGSATVIMRADVSPDGSLTLSSDGRRFGGPGFYFLVTKDDETAHVRFLKSVQERIHVYSVDGSLQADHALLYFGLRVFSLHYSMVACSQEEDEQQTSVS